jgi:two-component system nitrogen regulation sensor histidine kinase NtrY
MCRVAVGGVSERATLACAGVDRGGALWRIVSVQVIQSELDAAEIATQSDLVRVLTHEIMNSVTPVTSLAASAAALMASIDTGADDGVTDARLAVEALARRAAGIMHFVDSYREFSTAPAVTVTRFAARTWLDEIARLFAATPHAAGVSLDVQVVPDWLEIAADADLLAQVLLNLLKNGAEAMLDQQDRRLSIAISSTAQGRSRIVVDDSGPGILDKVATDIFLPFFTTKRAGTGVGLSFARQIVLLHHGSIEVGRSENSGARFDLIL